MNRAAIISALEAYRIVRGSGTSEPLRAVDVVGIADAILEAEASVPFVPKPGDLVQLRSGGPAMTVEALYDPTKHTPQASDADLLVVFFNGPTFEARWFPEVVLQSYTQTARAGAGWDIGSAIQRVEAMSLGKGVDDVYGAEGFAHPAHTFLGDLRAILAALKGG